MVHYHFGKKSKLWKAAIERLMHERGLVFPIGRLDLQDLGSISQAEGQEVPVGERCRPQSQSHPHARRHGPKRAS